MSGTNILIVRYDVNTHLKIGSRNKWALRLWRISRSLKKITLYNYGPLHRETSRFVNLTIWMFPYTEGSNCFIIFLPMLYRLSPLWGDIGLFGGEQLGCSAGNNWVVRRGTIGLLPGSANVCQCCIGFLPCREKLGCSVGNNRVVSRQRKLWQTSQLFYYLMTNLIQSKSTT